MVESFYRPTWVEISLDALRDNLVGIRDTLPEGMQMMAVIKADAYGHGALEVAKEAVACGATYLGVAFLDEALELRRAGITTPILVLGYTSPEGLRLAMQYDITLNVFSDDVLEAIARLDNIEETGPMRLKIHVKIDTGMGRIGLHETSSAIAFIERALATPNAEVEGIFTHYATADEADKTYMNEQYRRFSEVVRHFQAKGVSIPYIHAGNSATAIDCPELTYNMVRLGILMYGLYPSEEVDKSRVKLTPVLSLKSRIVQLKTLPPGSGISYNLIYRTSGEERIATLPIGYADGYTRVLNRQAEALVRGRRVPVVGSICMDQCMLHVDGVPDAALHDEVVLIGAQGDDRITADELALKLGTINYEITCMVSHRVPRVYMRGGQVVHVSNGLWHLAGCDS